ncbi:MAG: thermonuclease family protein [Gammaproteobacteria bacterium]|nr:thermonuclease family protein [Gammaproteobacteria bacterium]
MTGAYDGDTIYVEAAIWPNMTWTGGVRVLGVDTPEIRGSCEIEKSLAVMARDYVRTLLIDKTVRLTQIENDKYGGRVLARVYFWEYETWVELANRLIEQHMGRVYDGGTRPDWCPEEDPGERLESDGLGWEK